MGDRTDEELMLLVPLRPIRSIAAHTQAVRMLSALGQLERMNRDQSEYFEVLADLVERGERRRWPIDAASVSVRETLRSFLADHGMTASDLGRLLGERTLGHKVLTGKRKLTTAQVRTLANHFHVSTDLFIAWQFGRMGQPLAHAVPVAHRPNFPETPVTRFYAERRDIREDVSSAWAESVHPTRRRIDSQCGTG